MKKYKLKNKRQVLRNCVLPEIGLYIFKTMKQIAKENWEIYNA